MSRQSAAKLLSKYKKLYEEGSTTIPRKGSTLELILVEKPEIKFEKLFDVICYDKSTCIYGIYTPYNDKLYIGSSLNLQHRLRKHREKLKSNKHNCKWMQNVYNKYSKEYFLYFKVVNVENKYNLENVEKHYINLFNTVKNGYNATDDTKRNFLERDFITKNKKRQSKPVIALSLEGELKESFGSVSDAAKYFNTSSSNISRCCQGKINYIKNRLFIYKSSYNKNKKYSFKKSRIFTKQHCKNIAKGLRGEKHSEERRLKISYKQGQKIICLTNNICYFSLEEAGRDNNLSPSSIKRAILNKRQCKGLLFKFN